MTKRAVSASPHQVIRVPLVSPISVNAIAAFRWLRIETSVIITSLLFLTPHIQLAAQSCWLYDLNMFGIWPLLSAALSSFCVDFVIALELVSPALAGSFPRNSSPLPPHLSSYDLGYIISLLQSYKESLLYTAWSEGSSNRYWNYSSMARWSMDPLVWFIMELWKRQAIMENHR